MTTQSMTQIIADYFKTQPVLKAWLFGSFARGEERPDSDVDILVMLDQDAHVGLFKLSGMHLELQDLLQNAYSGDSRSPIPMISVHSVGYLLYRRQS